MNLAGEVGGFDPVENASFMPWLMATALSLCYRYQ